MDQKEPTANGSTRRVMLQSSVAVLSLIAPLRFLAAAEGGAADAATAAIVGKRAVTAGGIKLSTPAIAENGNTVPIAVEVEGRFSGDNYVKAIHVLAVENPTPEVISFYFTPASGMAKVATRIRLAKTQRVIALAEMSDDRVLQAVNEVKVTIGGCGG